MKSLGLVAFSMLVAAQQAMAGTEEAMMCVDCPTYDVPEAGTIGMLALGVAAVAAVRFWKK